MKLTTMCPDLQRLKNLCEGRTVLILGGGPSVTPSVLDQLNKLRNKVICLNAAFKYIQHPLAIMWCDDGWASTNLQQLSLATCPRFYTKTNAPAHVRTDIKSIASATVLNKTGDFGLDADIDCVRGNNSGAHAINLLLNCKVARIGLVGFDMQVEGTSTTHFHKDYTYAIRPSVYAESFIPSLQSMSAAIRDHGIPTRIYNCNKFSALKCFEYKKLEELI